MGEVFKNLSKCRRTHVLEVEVPDRCLRCRLLVHQDVHEIHLDRVEEFLPSALADAVNIKGRDDVVQHIGVGLDPLVHDVAQVSAHLRGSRPNTVASVLPMNLVEKPGENVEGGLDLGDVPRSPS